VRTAIYLGLIYVGDAIGTPSYVVTGNNVVAAMAIALLVFAVMDVFDFFRNRKAG
jgi:hypothetical protein